MKGIMKQSILSALALAIFGSMLLPLPAARAEQNRFYLQADVGGTDARDVQLRDFFGQPIAANSEITLDPGIRFGIRGGYGLTDWLAAEVETSVSANNIDSITGASKADGSIANVPLLLNLRLHVPERNRVSPYIGGGFGMSSTILDGDNITINHASGPPGSTTLDGTTTDVVFAYQGFAGLRFAINESMGLSVEYRYFRAESSNMNADLITFGVASDRVKLGRTETHSISVAFDVRF
jgi:opacity protein-like surface antigen